MHHSLKTESMWSNFPFSSKNASGEALGLPVNCLSLFEKCYSKQSAKTNAFRTVIRMPLK